jgi:hypothetical protein
MDQATLLKIARLRTMAAKAGMPFDVVRFATDQAFARETLANLLNGNDEVLVAAGLELMQRMGLLAPAPAAPTPAAAKAKPAAPPAEADKKYVGRLR